MPSKIIRIVIADDHEVFVDAFKELLNKQPDFKVVGTALNGKDLLTEVRSKQPDIVLMDVKMPEMDGFEATLQVRKEFPHTDVIGISMYGEPSTIADMFNAGARGFMLKEKSGLEIMSGIRKVAAGELYFEAEVSKSLIEGMAGKKGETVVNENITQKEQKILQLLAKEYSNKQIAEELKTTVRAVESAKERLQKKTGAKNAIGLVIYALKKGISKLDS